MRRALLLATSTTAALLLTACGGGDDGEDAKAAYVERAGAVCSSALEDFEALPQPAGAADLAPFAQGTLEIAERAESELSALTPPEADRAELESKVLTPFAELVEQGREFVGKVEAAGTDQAALLPLLAERPSAAGIDLDYLRSYGLDSCAEAISRAA